MYSLLILWLLSQPPASPCDRATTLLVRLIRDNTAALTGERAMTPAERAKVERELEKASGECKEAHANN